MTRTFGAAWCVTGRRIPEILPRSMRLRPALSRTLRAPSGISLETHTTRLQGIDHVSCSADRSAPVLICSPTAAGKAAPAQPSAHRRQRRSIRRGRVWRKANEVRVVFSEPMVALGQRCRRLSRRRSSGFSSPAVARHVSLVVRDDDPDLHAGSGDAAALLRRATTVAIDASAAAARQVAGLGAAARLQRSRRPR